MAKAAKHLPLLPCFQFGDCIGFLVEEYLVISSVYALIDYIILIFFLWLQADHILGHKGLWFQADHRLNHIWPRIWNMAYHRLDHICPEYGQPETINLDGPEYDQPGIILWV